MEPANPYSAPGQAPAAPPSADADAPYRAILGPLAASAGWMKFAGILMIVYGGLCVLTIWGVIIAWLPIWLGIVLLQAGARLRDGYERGDVRTAAEGADKLRFWFMLTGILLIVFVALFVLAFVAGIGMAVFGAVRQH